MKEYRTRQALSKLKRGSRAIMSQLRGWIGPDKCFLRLRAYDYRWRNVCGIGDYVANYRMARALTRARVRHEQWRGLHTITIYLPGGRTFSAFNDERHTALVMAERLVDDFFNNREP